MAKNVNQLPDAISVQTTDKFYIGRFPYNNTDDYAITWSEITNAIPAISPVQSVNTYTGAVNTNGAGVLSISTNTAISTPFPSRISVNTNGGSVTLTFGAFTSNNVVLGQQIEVVNIGSTPGNNVIIHNSLNAQIANNIPYGSASSLFRVSSISPDQLDNIILGTVAKYNSGDTLPINITGSSGTAGTITGTITASQVSNFTTASQAVITSDIGTTIQAYSGNLQGFSTLDTTFNTGPVVLTGASGGVATFHSAVGSVFSGTAFDTVTNTVGWGDQINFSSASAKTLNLQGTIATSIVGFYFIVTNSGAGAISLTTTVGNTIFGPNAIPGGTSNANTPSARITIVNISGGSNQWFVDVVNGGSLIAGTNISLTPGTSGTTIANTGFATYAVTNVTGTSQAMAANQGYLANNAGLVTLSLPTANCAIGSIIEVAGNGAGGWSISQAAGQSINFNSLSTTIGVGGSLASTNRYNSLRLIASVANTTFTVMSASGNLTIV